MTAVSDDAMDRDGRLTEGNGEERENGEDDEVRKGALEFMTTQSEAKPSMLKGVEAWVNIVVRGCLEGMGEIPEDDTEAWLEADVSTHHAVSSAL